MLKNFRIRAKLLVFVFLLNPVGALLIRPSMILASTMQPESLTELVMDYVQQLRKNGPNHPSTEKLRSPIVQKLKDGERLNTDQLTERLDFCRSRFHESRKELGDSHPNTVEVLEDISVLAELLTREPQSFESVDALALSKGPFKSELLYVPERRIAGQAHLHDPAATEVTLNKGSEDGIKVGHHLHIFALPETRTPRWQPDINQVSLVQVISVESAQSKAEVISSLPGSKQLAREFAFQTPAYPLGTLILAMRFDEATWKNRPLMNAFISELNLTCSKSITKPILLLVDVPSTRCEIEILPLGRGRPTEDLDRILSDLTAFLGEQVYISGLELKKKVLATKANQPAATQSAQRNGTSSVDQLKTDRLERDSQVMQSAAGASDEQLVGLRTKADESEKASIAKAIEVREAIAATPSKDAAAIEELKSELSRAVDAAFEARHDLQLMEVELLTNKAQALSQKLDERVKSRADIVRRRVDELLNPNYSWDGFFSQTPDAKRANSQERTTSSSDHSPATEMAISRQQLGWQISRKDSVLELIAQIPPDKANLNKVSESAMVVPNVLKGRFGRIIVRVGISDLPRQPSIERLSLMPMLPSSGEKKTLTPGNGLFLKAYTVTSDLDIAHHVASELLTGRPNVRLAKDESVKRLILLAQPEEHDLIKDALEELAGKTIESGIEWEILSDGQSQIIVFLSANKLRAMQQKDMTFPAGQDYVTDVDGSIVADRIVVRFGDSDASQRDSTTLVGSVEGLVTHRGKPVMGEIVFFRADQRPLRDGVPTAINNDGKYRLESLPVGSYRVSISDSLGKLPKKYSIAETLLEIEVSPARNQLDFDLQ